MHITICVNNPTSYRGAIESELRRPNLQHISLQPQDIISSQHLHHYIAWFINPFFFLFFTAKYSLSLSSTQDRDCTLIWNQCNFISRSFSSSLRLHNTSMFHQGWVSISLLIYSANLSSLSALTSTKFSNFKKITYSLKFIVLLWTACKWSGIVRFFSLSVRGIGRCIYFFTYRMLIHPQCSDCRDSQIVTSYHLA